MKTRALHWGILAAVIGILPFGTGCKNNVQAADGLTQEEAEKISSNIYIAACHPPQSGLTRTVKLGKPDPNGHIREKYGPVLVFPVKVNWTGSCSGHLVGPQQTDFFENVNAQYSANYFKDDFGEWKHTPFVGSCRRVYKAYQQQGGPMVPVPDAKEGDCSVADTVND